MKKTTEIKKGKRLVELFSEILGLEKKRKKEIKELIKEMKERET